MEKKKKEKEGETPVKEAAEPQDVEQTGAKEDSKTEASETGAENAENAASGEQSELAKCKAEAEDFKRKWYSVTAEYENYRKRTANTGAQRYAEGRADVVSKLFPVADTLELALAACSDEATKKGIGMVIASFEKILSDEKISVIDPVGQPFDAEKCEAIMALDPQEGEESGTVKQVYRKGYEQNGKILRYAQVVVIK